MSITAGRLTQLRKMKYEDYLKTPEWKKRRRGAVAFAGERCQLCNSDKAPLSVHHRTYENLGAEMTQDLVALCEDCHAKHHDVASEPTPDEMISDTSKIAVTEYLKSIVPEGVEIDELVKDWTSAQYFAVSWYLQGVREASPYIPYLYLDPEHHPLRHFLNVWDDATKRTMVAHIEAAERLATKQPKPRKGGK